MISLTLCGGLEEYSFFCFFAFVNDSFLAVQAWLKESNILVEHHPTLSNPTCCTRLATMLHQTSSSTSSNVSFVLRSEQQCGICLAITFMQQCCTRACAAAIGIDGDRCICFARCHVSSSFRMVNEPSLEYLSDESLSMQSLFEQIAPSCVQSSQGHGANVSAGSFASQDPGTLLLTH